MKLINKKNEKIYMLKDIDWVAYYKGNQIKVFPLIKSNNESAYLDFISDIVYERKVDYFSTSKIDSKVVTNYVRGVPLDFVENNVKYGKIYDFYTGMELENCTDGSAFYKYHRLYTMPATIGEMEYWYNNKVVDKKEINAIANCYAKSLERQIKVAKEIKQNKNFGKNQQIDGNYNNLSTSFYFKDVIWCIYENKNGEVKVEPYINIGSKFDISLKNIKNGNMLYGGYNSSYSNRGYLLDVYSLFVKYYGCQAKVQIKTGSELENLTGGESEDDKQIDAVIAQDLIVAKSNLYEVQLEKEKCKKLEEERLAKEKEIRENVAPCPKIKGEYNKVIEDDRMI